MTTYRDTVHGWQIERILEDVRNAADADRSSYERQLTELLEQYTGRRSVEAEMIRKVARLAAEYAAEQQRRHDEHLATVQAALTAEHEKATAGHDAIVERLEEHQKILRMTNTRLTKALNEKRTIREEREAARGDGDTQVTIRTDHHGWTVAMLEEIAYRLRSGGAVDDTPVDVDQRRAVANVPAPNMITLEGPTRAPTPLLPDPTHEAQTAQRRRSRDPRLTPAQRRRARATERRTAFRRLTYSLGAGYLAAVAIAILAKVVA